MKDLTHTETTQVNSVMKAMSSKLIKDSTDQELASKFSIVYFMIGLRPQHLPNAEEAKTLFGYMRQTYPLRTIEEIILAFKNYVELKYCTEIKFYDQFTLINLNSIMNAYRQYVNDLNSKLREVKPPESNIPKSDIHQDIEEMLNRTDLSKRNLVLIPGYIYDNMFKLGYINQDETTKASLYRIASEIFESRLRHDAENFDKYAIGKLNRFLKEKENYFDDISDINISEIHKIYQKLSVLHEIKKYQRNQKDN